MGLGKPENISEYTAYDVENLPVYVQNSITARDDQLTVKYTKLLWNESLTVDGIVY